MALIPIDASLSPAPSPLIEDRIAAQLAHPMIGLSREGITTTFVKSWQWARAAETVAKELAARLSDSGQIAEAQRIATRHSGVWRAANKMVKRDSKGKETRAVVPIRADAGDSTCPTWLDRECRKRVKEMTPICLALINLGYTINVAQVSSLSRFQAQAVMQVFRSPHFRKAVGIHGLDILCVPSSPTEVRLLFLAVFKKGSVPPEIGVTHDLKLHFRACFDIDACFFAAPSSACIKLGVQTWIAAQVNRVVDGKRQRDRITFGCLYGNAAEEVVREGSVVESAASKCDEKASQLIESTKRNIASAISICSRAAGQGDLVAAVQARSYARAYAEDLTNALGNSYPTLCLAISYMARYDLSGLANVPVMEHIHTELMSAINSLPLPANRDSLDNVWFCVEMVKVHSPQDIANLAAWMREESKHN